MLTCYKKIFRPPNIVHAKYINIYNILQYYTLADTNIEYFNFQLTVTLLANCFFLIIVISQQKASFEMWKPMNPLTLWWIPTTTSTTRRDTKLWET